ncbi:MAG: response regulator [Desulfobacterales bacterium]|nr:response regulator [Desulfobacterales bacterium]MDJ0874676.1 response regulator [Desulfobacterales bacterium]
MTKNRDNRDENSDFRSLSFDVCTVKALMASTNRYKTLFESAGDAIFVMDFKGQIIDGNRVACEKLRLSRHDMLNQTTMDIISPEHAPFWPERMDELRRLRHIIFETALKAEDGTIVPVEASCRAIEYDNQPAVLTIARDITERIEAEKEKAKLRSQLRQAQKMEAIGTLAGGIAHDFNNILQSIFGYTEIASIHASQGKDPNEALDNILTASQRAKGLINQILSFSRQSEQEKQTVQINLIVKEVLKLIRASLPATIEIKGRNLNSDAVVEADPIQIHQVMMNLCSNAHHAMREGGGVLEVKLSDIDIDREKAAQCGGIQEGPYIELTIRDSGHGIPTEYMDRIFDPYFTSKEKGEGTGLGLAVVHGIISSHGGAITVESEISKGTAFHVIFPKKNKISAQDKPAAVDAPGRQEGTERILFIDDEPALIDIGKEILSTLGYDVTPCTASDEALDLFKADPERFDLVITDLTMPKMTGDLLAQELMRMRPEIPVILFTGYSDLVSRERFNKLGIRDCLMKPLTRKDLAESIRRVLDTPATDTEKPAEGD